MKLEALVVLVALAGCGKSDSSHDKPAEPPSLSDDGKQKVPPGYETQFKFGSRDVRLEYTWVSIEHVNGRPAFSILAQGSGMGLFRMSAPIPEHTPSFSALAGGSTPAFPTGVSFGLTADMTHGNGADIKITEVTPTSMSGTFTTQACPQNQPRCSNPTNVSGTFKAYRSALSDDAMFERVYVKKQ
jgi:hypothetical protein